MLVVVLMLILLLRLLLLLLLLLSLLRLLTWLRLSLPRRLLLLIHSAASVRRGCGLVTWRAFSSWAWADGLTSQPDSGADRVRKS